MPPLVTGNEQGRIYRCSRFRMDAWRSFIWRIHANVNAYLTPRTWLYGTLDRFMEEAMKPAHRDWD